MPLSAASILRMIAGVISSPGTVAQAIDKNRIGPCRTAWMSETAIDLNDAQHAFALFSDRIAHRSEQFVNLPESGTCRWSHIRLIP